MPRPLLEIWRDLNLDRNREPSSLLKRMIADTQRELSSPAALKRQMLARSSRSTASPLEQAIASAVRKPLSLTQRAIADMIRKENGVAGRILGTPRPVSPAPSSNRRRKPGAGRHRVLTQEQIDAGIKLLHDSGSLPELSEKEARRMLRSAGINASDSTLDRLIIKPARTPAR